MKIYISTRYGNPEIKRVIPFEFAKACGIFEDYTSRIEKAVNEDYEAKAAKFEREMWKAYEANIEPMTKAWLRNDPDRNKRWWTCIDYELKQIRSEVRGIIAAHKDGFKPHFPDGPGYEYWLEETSKNGDICVKNLPEYVPEAVLDSEQIAAIKKYVCGKHREPTSLIDGVARICELFLKPENHILVKTNPNARTKTMREMIDEMVHELTNLPRFAALAKTLEVLGQIGEVKHTRKAKITTMEMPREIGLLIDGKRMTYNPCVFTEQYGRDYCRTREEIDREISVRQAEWNKKPEVRLSNKPPPTSY